MKTKNFIVALRYLNYYALPVIVDKIPDNSDYIEVTVINVPASKIVMTLDKKYHIKGSKIEFYDPQNLMDHVSTGEIHLVLTANHSVNDDESSTPKTKVVHAGMVDAEHASEFEAFAYNYHGELKMDIGGVPDKYWQCDALDKALEVNAPYIFGIVSRSFICDKVDTDGESVYFNDKYEERTFCNPQKYLKIAPGRTVQMNQVIGFGDLYDGFFGLATGYIEDVKSW